MLSYISTTLYWLGFFLKKNQAAIRTIQWCVIAFYLIFLIIPAFMPIPPFDAYIFSNLALLSKFIFWGIWWPFVILSVLILGRFWCGIFCPEGALAELTSSKFGMGKTIPRWIKWRGWPLVAFSLTTIYGQLISVYDYAKPALLILGGSTIFAMVISYLYGKRGTRIWCKYLCPVNGVFNLISRLAPLSYKVDEDKWSSYKGKSPKDPQCAPMINLHQLKGVSGCHMCGRCSGFKDSIKLEPRSVNEEIVKYGFFKTTSWDRHLLLFGMISLALGAFTWTKNPNFILYKQTLGTWLVNNNIFWPLNENAPWWILTNYPSIRDSFNWLDGFCLITYIMAHCLILGGFLNLIIYICYRISNKKITINHFAMSLIPMAFAVLFLGLSATSIKLLNNANINIPYTNLWRGIILTISCIWSLYLANAILKYYKIFVQKRIIILAVFSIDIATITAIYLYMFWLW